MAQITGARAVLVVLEDKRRRLAETAGDKPERQRDLEEVEQQISDVRIQLQPANP